MPATVDDPVTTDALSSADRLALYSILGWRSALAAKTLRDMGLTNAAHLGSGTVEWQAHRGLVEERQT
jgi:rhodanese-related sulfurtransferase